MSRRGKIARLPEKIRAEVNARLDDAEPASTLLDWLNALPEVQEVIKSQFAGAPITPQNLSDWRQGGFREWRITQDLLHGTANLSNCACKLDDNNHTGRLLVDDLVLVLTARLAALVGRWDEESDAHFDTELRTLRGLIQDVVKLQRSTHQTMREVAQLERLAEEKEAQDLVKQKEKLVAIFRSDVKGGGMATFFGGGEDGEKMARLVSGIEHATDHFELEGLLRAAVPQPGTQSEANPKSEIRNRTKSL